VATKKLRAAVHGAGWVAGEHIKGYLAHPDAELVVLNSRFEHELEAQRSRFGLKCELTVDGFEDLCARDDVDVVSICTINFLHAREGVALADAGKNILVEKPVATTFKDLKALRDAVLRNKVKSHAGFVARWYPLPEWIKSIVEAGDLGKVFFSSIDYWHEIIGEWKTKVETAGSALLMGGCHAVDMTRWYRDANGPIVEVQAYSVPAQWRKDYEYDPTISVNLKFADGTVGRVGCCLESAMPYVFNIELMGDKGAVRNERYYSNRYPSPRQFMEIPAERPDSPDVTHHPFPEEIGYFVDRLLEGKDSAVNVEDAYVTHEICFAAEKSARTGKPVKLPLK
jgi:predicted dehydrogenase